MTNEKTAASPDKDDPDFPSKLNDADACFNMLSCHRGKGATSLRKLKRRKGISPNKVTPAVPSHRTSRLAPGSTATFSHSVSAAVPPKPTAQPSDPSCLNDMLPWCQWLLEQYLHMVVSSVLPQYWTHSNLPTAPTDLQKTSSVKHSTLRRNRYYRHGYLCKQFMDSSGFSTVSPLSLFTKTNEGGQCTALGHWLLDSLSCSVLSTPLTISTGVPQGSCVLSLLPFSMFINKLTSQDSSMKIPEYADDTTITGSISDNNEAQYQIQVDRAGGRGKIRQD